MKIFYNFIYTFLLLMCEYQSVYTRTAYDSSQYMERDDLPMISPYTKKKLLKEELIRDSNEDGNEPYENQNSMYEAPRYRQYDPSELYFRQAPRSRSNLNNMYEIRKRDYGMYPEMRQNRDPALELVLDPKNRKAVAVIDNSPGQEPYDIQNWKNSRDDLYGYENEYPQGNQDQVVNLVYPASRQAVRSVDNQQYDNNQMAMQSNSRTNQNQLVYKAAISEPGREEIVSQKIKRHAKDKKEITENKDKQEVVNNEETLEKTEKVKNTNKKRSVPNWSNEQISALKDSLTLLQENKADYDNLKRIMNDMGLAMNPDVKRDIINVDKSEIVDDDENLNLNDITMMKSRKWDNSDGQEVDKRELHETNKKEDDKKLLKSRGNKVMHTKNRQSEQKHSKQDQDDEDDDEERKKRNSETSTNTDLMKNLEKSGELTVSGNKSPLVSIEKDSEKNHNERSTDQAVDKRNSKNEDYEEEIENEIQAKIDAIKEKVKREILLQKQKQNRNKRATLIDTENKYINPEYFANDDLKPHIRTRRRVEDTSNNTINNTVNENELQTNHTRIKRESNEESDDNQKSESKQKKSSKEIENEDEDQEKELKEDSDAVLNIPDRGQYKTFRRKRAKNGLPENKVVFRPYLSQQDEEEENEGEGEFDNAYDQAYVEKRELYEPDFQYFDKNVDENPEFQAMERAPNYIGNIPERRQRRSHTSYIQEPYENYRPFSRYRRSRLGRRDRYKRDKLKNKRNRVSHKVNLQNVETDDQDDVDNDFFGGLSQNYQEGELNRYKRVKRSTNDTNLKDVT